MSEPDPRLTPLADGILIPARPVTRRAMIRSGLAMAGGLLLTGGCAGSSGAAAGPTISPPRMLPDPRDRRLAPVLAEHDRVIRTVAGIRPYRDEGFVVRAEPLGDRTVVHNYGHGGGGISLAWGSSELAAELATATGHRSFAVIGSGVMGLTTARRLQDRGFDVTIYTRDLPPETTSNIAGGHWTPTSVFRPGSASPEFLRQFERAARISHRLLQNQVGDRYGVRWIENYHLLDEAPTGPLWWAALRPISDLYPDLEVLGPGEHPFPSPYARRQLTMMVEPAIFLDALTRDFLIRGGRIEVRAFASLAELAALPEPVVVNCTGYGSRALFGDEGLVPVKGQLAILVPQPEVDYIMFGGGAYGYMFPRTDGIVLGGTFERGVETLDVEPQVIANIVAEHAAVFGAMR